jgi:hypothetical protein
MIILHGGSLCSHKNSVALLCAGWVGFGHVAWLLGLLQAIVMATTGTRDMTDLDDMVWTLRNWPLELIQWPMTNSHRLDLTYTGVPDREGAIWATHAVLRLQLANVPATSR